MHHSGRRRVKPASTWGNTTGAGLHDVCYGTLGWVQSAAATTIASPPGPDSVPAYPAGYPKTRNGHQAPVSGILPETWEAPVRPDSRPVIVA